VKKLCRSCNRPFLVQREEGEYWIEVVRSGVYRHEKVNCDEWYGEFKQQAV